jgi:hypothetical protein
LVRRIISITLLLAFSFALISPLLALGSTPESSLPACCRRGGAHHCMLSAEQIAALEHGTHFTSVRNKCPMFPVASLTAHHEQLAFNHASLLFAAVLSHPAQFQQVLAWARVALEGARHKRGPPSVRLS